MLKKLIQLSIAGLLAASASANAAISITGTATFGGHTYQLLSTDTWLASESFAQTIGGHLAAINDQAEMDFLNATWGNLNLWIGLQRVSGIVGQGNDPVTSFAWVNGETSTYRNWASGEPNNWDGGENAVHTYANSGQWNDLSSSSDYVGAKYGVAEIAAVPEPDEYALLLAGLGLLGFALRRRTS
jgi:hypothetical protein